jgi:prolycopene isomerase
LEKPYGSIFLSIPTVLDPSLAPEGHHIFHIFTTAGIEDWEVRTRTVFHLKYKSVNIKKLCLVNVALLPSLAGSF